MCSDNDIVLSVKNVSKCFEMYEKPVHRLYQTLCAGKKKFYKEFWALKDISFDVHRGECVGIIGRNGAGKSTLLQIITGTLSPTTGSVNVKGRIAALLELGSGFNPEFTGRENVYLNGAILGFDKAAIDARYDEIVSFADIGEFIDQPVKTYSSGMMVRLAFAVQVMVDPDILIVDEALAVGDILFQKKCYSRISSLVARGVTFIFVTHDMETMRSMTKKAVLLNAGEMLQFADSADVLLTYRRLLHKAEEAYMQDIVNKLNNAGLQRPPVGGGEGHDAAAGNGADASIGGMSFGKEEVRILEVTPMNAQGEYCTSFMPQESIRIRVVCESDVNIDHLNVALRIRNKQGVKMYSWGTLNQDMASHYNGGSRHLFWDRVFHSGEKFGVEFECICALGCDIYEVQAAVAYEGALDYSLERILHWKDNAVIFKVGMDMKSYFFGGCMDMKMVAREV